MSSVWFDGIEDLTRLATGLGQVGRGAMPLARQAVTKTCADIQARAAAPPSAGGAPRDTGFLAGSVGYDVRSSGLAVEGEVGPTASYGAFVEWGTSRMPPQPYMGPAFDTCAPGLERTLLAISARFGAFGSG